MLEPDTENRPLYHISHINTKTIWANNLPANYLPNKVLKIGKNPGLKENELHKMGIKGQGIGIAVIDGDIFINLITNQ